MIFFISTQKRHSAAGAFHENLLSNSIEKSIQFYEINKGLISLIKLANKLKKNYSIYKDKEKKITIITDFGCIKCILLLLISFLDLRKITIYTTYYHHIYNLQECIKYFQFNEVWKSLALRHFSFISIFSLLEKVNFITVSKFTADRLNKDFYIPKNRIYILWNQILEKSFKPISVKKIKAISDVPEDFILLISSLQSRKNIKAINYVCKTYKSKIVFITQKPKNNYQSKLLKSFESLNVRILFSVDEATKISLFSKCKCLFVPSYFEGLSLLPLEAIVYKVPMLLSNIPTHLYWKFPTYIYFNPRDMHTIKDKLDKYLFKERINVDYLKSDFTKNLILQSDYERSDSIKKIFIY